MDIDKVSYKKGKVAIFYRNRNKTNPSENDHHSIKTADTPAPEFVRALQQLAMDVASICELGFHEKIYVTGVTFSHGDAGELGATITAEKELSGIAQPLCVNSPHITDREGSPNPMPSDTRRRLLNLADLAARFVNGERAQMNLFGGDSA